MTARDETFRKSYRFLRLHEDAGTSFSLEEIAREVGWKPRTARTYSGKRWRPFIRQGPDGRYMVHGLGQYTEDEYVQHMSQVAGRPSPIVSDDPNAPPAHVVRLLEKAREAATLAIEVYNRPSTTFRTEAFTMLMVVAWRNLFHAIFASEQKDYIYRNTDGTPQVVDGEERAWELKRCLAEYYEERNPPERANLELIIALRNKAEHRYAPDFDSRVVGECQACVTNFDRMITDTFGPEWTVAWGTPPLFTSRVHARDVSRNVRTASRHYAELEAFIKEFKANVSQDILDDPSFSLKVFLVPKTGNRPGSSDVAMEFIPYSAEHAEAFSEVERAVTLIRDRHVPVRNAGNLKAMDVVARVAARLSHKFNKWHHAQAWKMYGVRSRGKQAAGCDERYCQFDEAFKDYVYTEQWVEFLIEKLSDEDEYNRLLTYRG